MRGVSTIPLEERQTDRQAAGERGERGERREGEKKEIRRHHSSERRAAAVGGVTQPPPEIKINPVLCLGEEEEEEEPLTGAFLLAEPSAETGSPINKHHHQGEDFEKSVGKYFTFVSVFKVQSSVCPFPS